MFLIETKLHVNGNCRNAKSYAGLRYKQDKVAGWVTEMEGSNLHVFDFQVQ